MASLHLVAVPLLLHARPPLQPLRLSRPSFMQALLVPTPFKALLPPIPPPPQPHPPPPPTQADRFRFSYFAALRLPPPHPAHATARCRLHICFPAATAARGPPPHPLLAAGRLVSVRHFAAPQPLCCSATPLLLRNPRSPRPSQDDEQGLPNPHAPVSKLAHALPPIPSSPLNPNPPSQPNKPCQAPASSPTCHVPCPHGHPR